MLTMNMFSRSSLTDSEKAYFFFASFIIIEVQFMYILQFSIWLNHVHTSIYWSRAILTDIWNWKLLESLLLRSTDRFLSVFARHSFLMMWMIFHIDNLLSFQSIMRLIWQDLSSWTMLLIKIKIWNVSIIMMFFASTLVLNSS